MRRFSLILALIVPMLSASTIYTYTGNNFTQVSGSGGPTTSDFVSVSFEIQAPLPGSLLEWNGRDVGQLISWTISDGINVLSSNNTIDTIIDLGVATDEFGNIVHWDVGGIAPNFSLWIETVNPPYTCCPGSLDQSDTFGNGSFMAPTAVANNTDNSGTWSVTSDVPEPATWKMLLLTLAGLAGIAGVARLAGRIGIAGLAQSLLMKR